MIAIANQNDLAIISPRQYLGLFKKMNLLQENSELEILDFLHLTGERVKAIICGYGFIEVNDIFKFIEFLCHGELDTSELVYIRNKIGLCLRRHDDGQDYFIPLREFATELDCLIDINSHQPDHY
ncbi:hypothetical protein [Pantoea sp. Lu_F5_004]|uniref:hypothetical protein n=1 Tax=Pantoea sp. Lu_F5_004 TaxID=3443507 RepID=UPI003EB7D03E